jgi:hypothetical protein
MAITIGPTLSHARRQLGGGDAPASIDGHVTVMQAIAG